MNFFGIGALEFLVILFVMLLVVGPDRVPEYARKASHFINQARRTVSEARETLLPDLDVPQSGLRLDEFKKRPRPSDQGPASSPKS